MFNSIPFKRKGALKVMIPLLILTGGGPDDLTHFDSQISLGNLLPMRAGCV